MADSDEDEWQLANYYDRVEHIHRTAQERSRALQEAARARAAERSRREHTIAGARERYNEDLQAGLLSNQTPILSSSEGGSQSATSVNTAIVGKAESEGMDTSESKKRKATGAIHIDDGGAENDGNTDAEAAGFGLGRIRPIGPAYCGTPTSVTRCYKKRMHFTVNPKTLKSMATQLRPLDSNSFACAAIGFQDWIVIPWKICRNVYESF